jgi:hypothetical protein
MGCRPAFDSSFRGLPTLYFRLGVVRDMDRSGFEVCFLGY